MAPLDDGPSDEEILANSSDEEDDSSSISSKGDSEQPEESPVRRRLFALCRASDFIFFLFLDTVGKNFFWYLNSFFNGLLRSDLLS